MEKLLRAHDGERKLLWDLRCYRKAECVCAPCIKERMCIIRITKNENQFRSIFLYFLCEWWWWVGLYVASPRVKDWTAVKLRKSKSDHSNYPLKPTSQPCHSCAIVILRMKFSYHFFVILPMQSKWKEPIDFPPISSLFLHLLPSSLIFSAFYPVGRFTHFPHHQRHHHQHRKQTSTSTFFFLSLFPS